MKRVILFFLILTLGASFAFADETKVKAKDATPTETPTTTPAATPTIGDQGQFYLGLGTGVDLPGTNWDPNYLLAGGTNVFVGYMFDKNLSVLLNGESWFFTGSGYSLYQLRTMVEGKYTFDGQGWQPYVLLGPGMVFQSLSPSGASTSNFDALAGLGAQFDLAPRTHLFIEAKYNFIMSQSTTFGDIPINAGIWVGL